ncbi:integrin beta-1-binding protein 1 isoform X3 [Falco biarmicus]|uniref:integrin beta-1-binding protein 1 isoform X3 n=1 Tax=Falco peregrinus TaxID=8954 RepID=UPI000679C04B|nr:integrin beta-1-binding protein 1 isoform X3 [Falco peregrinus]XP_014133160.1 integrin beta-1-binding protein 1 isoform X3 [Falco cherrug]XP_023778345.1 integrin beta-1-binding protein 1 isoform X2 [Cyanistes caeruleus]XP_030304487.1 integrin beta-1-binding protein 1 isoform X2 [Calypte anna]XP_037248325.1 integrin beta-1-binding protein 1 isoform X3 [Falco rusticolus]XP_040454650.1 integrin beta-1-binding protein 1 isoform X3 [Falco naumanni]XP_041333791.1 integrin beta-1-binding protein 
MFRKGKKRHSSSSSQSSEISTKSKSVDSSLGGLSRSSTVASLDTDSTKSSGEEEFIMGVSKYGIKVSTSDQYDVLHRHALYLIVRMVCYDDGLGAGKSLLALKTTDAASEECSLWVYQCNSLEQAQAICKVLSTAFDSVLMSEKS